MSALEIVEHDALDSLDQKKQADDLQVVLTLTPNEQYKVEALCEKADVDLDKIYKSFGVTTLGQIPQNKYKSICKRLEGKIVT